MKKIIKYSVIVIIIIIIIVTFLFLIKIIFKKQEKINQAESKQKELNDELGRLKQQKTLTDKELEKLSKKEVVIKYKEVIKEKEKVIDLSEKILEENKKNIKNWQECEQRLKMKDFMFISGIAGVGLDQEFNLLGQFGGTINGKVYDGLFTKIYLGGGGTYNPRINSQEIIHGGNLIFQTTFLIGK